MKNGVIGVLEALLALHTSGFRPTRSVLLAIGHDEEIGGPFGATAIAARLEAAGRRVALVWDEGMVLLSDGVGALARRPVAMIGTAEKVRCGPMLLLPGIRVIEATCAFNWRSVQGRAPFKINIATAGGHASMPPIDASHAGRVVGDVLRAIDTTQPPLALRSPVTDLFKSVAPHAPFVLRGLLWFCDTWCAAGDGVFDDVTDDFSRLT